MKVLITGATGFVGGVLVRELIKDGEHEVRVLVRKDSNISNIQKLDGLEITFGDLRDKESLKKALKGCRGLYHAAAHNALWARDTRIFYDVNVRGTQNILDAALEEGIEKVVYTSSIRALGIPQKGTLANEQTEFNCWHIKDHYMRSKYLAEQVCLKIVEKGLPVVMVNPTGPVGSRDIRPTPTGKAIVDFLNGKLPGYLEGGFNLIDVEDVAKGHILAFHKGKTGERYILGNRNISMKEFFLLLERISKVPAPKVRIPYPLALAAASLLELSSKITRKSPPLTVARVQIISKYIYFDCSKAVRELGLPQTPIELSLEKAVRWFRENGYVHI